MNDEPISVTVRAVGVVAPGGIRALRIVERSVRPPKRGEIRLAVKAAAVNPADILLRERGVEGLQPPWVPGMDAAGVIESVGAGVDLLKVGDEVMAAVTPRRPEGGAQAELIVAPAAAVAPIPDVATFAQAATLPMNGLTALLGLELLDVRKGEVLAVSGGAGLLASYVIPLSKMRGLHVLADANPEDEPLVRSFGADVVLPRGEDYPSTIRTIVPAGVHGFFDTALLGRSAFPAIRDEGVICVVRGWDSGAGDRAIRVRPVSVSATLERINCLDCAKSLERLSGLASQGMLQLRVAATYAPERAGDAHRVLQAGGLRGRAVIVF